MLKKLKLRTAEHLVNLIAIFCILARRIFWMAMLNRVMPDENSDCPLASAEFVLVDQIAERSGRPRPMPPRRCDYLCKIARLGEYFA